MNKTFFLIRLLSLSYISYQIYYVDSWIFTGFITMYILIEMAFIVISSLFRRLDDLTYIQAQTVSTDFGFDSHKFADDELHLIDAIREGKYEASLTFLSKRCNNKIINFKLLPASVCTLMALRLVNAIIRGESPSWEELLSDGKEKTT